MSVLPICSVVLGYSPIALLFSCEQSPVAPKKVNTEFPGAWSPEFHSGHAQNSRLGQLPSMLPARSLIHKQLQRSTQHCFWWLHFLSPSRVLQCKSVSQFPALWRLKIWLLLPPIILLSRIATSHLLSAFPFFDFVLFYS